MKIFPKPQNLNGTELITELATVGIVVKVIRDFGDGTIGFATDDESTAAAVVAAHNGTTVAAELSIENKLANVGLNLDDLKSALGL